MRSGAHHKWSVAVAVVAVLALACGSTGAGRAAARPADGAGPAPAPQPTARAPQPTARGPQPVTPRSSASFAPVQGDWEGTADGFAASFQVTYRPSMSRTAGLPQLGLQTLVLLRPNACPVNAAHYSESILGDRLPSPLGPDGSLGLSEVGLGGEFNGPRSATLTSRFRLKACRGTLTWRLHPAARVPVADGSWTVRFADRERSGFIVSQGGRLATGITLPGSLRVCNGLSGHLDLFIAPGGAAAVTAGDVRLALRFSGRHASGTLSAGGCPGGPAPVAATRVSG
jgi:hypothetical protein